MPKTTKTAAVTKVDPDAASKAAATAITKGKATAKDLDRATARELAAEAAATGAARANAATHISASKAQLARGIGGRDAPHSAKAVYDGKAAEAKATAKTKPAVAKKAARVAAKVAKAAPKADDNRKITVLDKAFTYGREGTSRRSSWDACAKAKTVTAYAAAGGALKYLQRWTAAGAIKLG